jgi:hypothetical protein
VLWYTACRILLLQDFWYSVYENGGAQSETYRYGGLWHHFMWEGRGKIGKILRGLISIKFVSKTI